MKGFRRFTENKVKSQPPRPIAIYNNGEWLFQSKTPVLVGKLLSVTCHNKKDRDRYEEWWNEIQKQRQSLSMLQSKIKEEGLDEEQKKVYQEEAIKLILESEKHGQRRPVFNKGRTIIMRVVGNKENVVIIEPSDKRQMNQLMKMGYYK